MWGFPSPRMPRRPTAFPSTMSAALIAIFFTLTVWPEPSHGQRVPLTPRTLIGVWRGQEISPVGRMTIEVIFFRNGTYSRSARLGAFMTRDVGTYSIVRNWIHFRLRDYAPKVYRGRRLARPMSDTWTVQRFNGRHLQATVGGRNQVSVQRIR